MSLFVTGIAGTSLFSLLFIGANYHFCRAQKMGKSLISSFFAAMIVYSALEIPQYVLMVVQESYESKVGYCLHVMAVGCYFVALSIICFSWMFLLFIEKQDKKGIAFKKRTIYVANGVLFVFILLSVYFCVTADSLDSFFDSKFYLIYMIVEVILFLFYNSAVVFFGMKISLRFQNYIKTGGEKTDAFKSALSKVLTLMVVNSICALTRVVMLILEIINNVNSSDSSQNSFAHHGLVWFALADFVPFCIGGATFMIIMVSGGTKKRSDYAQERLAEPPDACQSLLNSSAINGGEKSENLAFQQNLHPKTPMQHRQDNVVDSDIDNTPQTPDDEALTPLHDKSDDENHTGGVRDRRRAYSYDANSSVTTNSPYFGQRHNEFNSPHTPVHQHQRWMSFNSSNMLPNSLSPAPSKNLSSINNDFNINVNNSNHITHQPRQFAKSMTNLRPAKSKPDNISFYTPPPRSAAIPPWTPPSAS